MELSIRYDMYDMICTYFMITTRLSFHYITCYDNKNQITNNTKGQELKVTSS